MGETDAITRTILDAFDATGFTFPVDARSVSALTHVIRQVCEIETGGSDGTVDMIVAGWAAQDDRAFAARVAALNCAVFASTAGVHIHGATFPLTVTAGRNVRASVTVTSHPLQYWLRLPHTITGNGSNRAEATDNLLRRLFAWNEKARDIAIADLSL
jgi:hypothetical protein